MVEIDLQDQKQFEAWLDTQPREVCIAIAARVALRLLPVLDDLVRDSSLNPSNIIRDTALSVFRAMAMPLVFARFPSTRHILQSGSAAAASAASNIASIYGPIESMANAAAAAAVSINQDSAAAAANATSIAANSAAANSYGYVEPGYVEEGYSEIGDEHFRAAAAYDAQFIDSDGTAENLSAKPLWPEGTPGEVRKHWLNLRRRITSENEDWDVWIRWYDAVLDGKPTPGGEDLDIFRVTLDSEEDWQKGPAYVNELIKAKEKEIAPPRNPIEATIEERLVAADSITATVVSADVGEAAATTHVPSIPEEVPGPAWEVDPASGLIAPVFRHPELPYSEIDDMERLRPYLVACARDLLSSLNASLSNSVKQAVPIAENYLQSIDKHSSKVSVDEVYSLGVRLRNVHDRIRREVETEGMPDLTSAIGEAMDSVIGLHGPFVLSTSRGNELDRRARNHNKTKVQDLAYKSKSLEFAAAIAESNRLVRQDGKVLLVGVNNEIATGPFPERSTTEAEAANQNLLTRLARIATTELVKKVAFSSTVGVGSVAFGTDIANAAISWLGANHSLLIALAATSPEGLGWLPHFLNWLKAKVDLSGRK